MTHYYIMIGGTGFGKSDFLIIATRLKDRSRPEGWNVVIVS